VWDVLGDPDEMDGGRMLARALTMIAASAVDLEAWDQIAGDEFFEERIVLARYSKVVNAAWGRWSKAARENSFSYLPEQYEAACLLLKRPYDADDEPKPYAPSVRMRLAQLALCEEYNFGADALTDLVVYYYDRMAACVPDYHEARVHEDEYSEGHGDLAARRERGIPAWARCLRELRA
jgi:hypothetical protein